MLNKFVSELYRACEPTGNSSRDSVIESGGLGLEEAFSNCTGNAQDLLLDQFLDCFMFFIVFSLRKKPLKPNGLRVFIPQGLLRGFLL